MEQRLGFAAAIVSLIFFHEWLQQFPLFKTKQAFKALYIFFEKFFGFFRFIMILWVEKHSSAHAILSLLAHENVIIDTAFATGPECFVLGQFRIGHGFIAQVSVYFHDREAGGEAKYLCIRIFCPRQVKNSLLDGFGHATFSECGRDDQATVGNVFAMTPGFDVTKAHPLPVFGNGNDCFTLVYLCLDVLGTSLRYAGTPRRRR